MDIPSHSSHCDPQDKTTVIPRANQTLGRFPSRSSEWLVEWSRDLLPFHLHPSHRPYQEPPRHFEKTKFEICCFLPYNRHFLHLHRLLRPDLLGPHLLNHRFRMMTNLHRCQHHHVPIDSSIPIDSLHLHLCHCYCSLFSLLFSHLLILTCHSW